MTLALGVVGVARAVLSEEPLIETLRRNAVTLTGITMVSNSLFNA